MVIVDNSGKGNCMYYAYSISLMYFLRAKNKTESPEGIFNTLGLNNEEKAQLSVLLTQNTNKPFSQQEIKNIIEPILGTAVRALGAKSTKKEFLNNPRDTGLFTSAHYGLEYFFKVYLQNSKNDLHQLIDNQFDNPTFKQAEIYNLKGILPEMRQFIMHQSKSMLEEFQAQWVIKLQGLRNPSSPKDIQFHKSQLLNSIISAKTELFFKANNNKLLDLYCDHLNTNYVWGTEETLNTLHRAVQGETLNLDAKGKWQTNYERAIALRIDVKGQKKVSFEPPEIVIENHSNCHWVSKIPDEFLKLELSLKVAQQSQQTSEKVLNAHVQKQAVLRAAKLLEELEKINAQLPKELKAINEQVAADQRLAKMLQDIYDEQKNTLSIESIVHPQKTPELLKARQQFTDQLRLLATKIIDFERRIKIAVKEGKSIKELTEAKDSATRLYTGLDIEALRYFQNPTKKSYDQFKTQCTQKINDEREVLEHHRGCLELLGNIALAVLGLGVLYLVAVAINYACTGNYLFFKTESETIIDGFEAPISNGAP